MGLFNPNNTFFATLARLVDIVGLSLLWFFLSLPVITLGPATAALYHTVVRVFREKEESVFRRYLHSFRENCKVGIPAGLLCVGVGILLVYGFEIMYAHRSGLQAMAYAIYYICMVLPLGTVCYLFPLLGRFTFGLKDLFVTAVQLALAHLPTTVVLVLVTLEVVLFSIQHLWTIFFVPVGLAWFISLFLEKIFRKHMPTQNEEG